MARFTQNVGGTGSGSALNYVQVIGTQQTITSAPSNIIDLNITTTGKPVQISVTGEGSNASAGSWLRINLFRDGAAIGNEIQIEASATSENVPYAINFIDDVAAGTYNYSIRATDKSSGNWQFGEVAGPIMNAVELTGFKGDRGPRGIQGIQGEPGDTADFVFNYDDGDEESTMTIHNHDMVIRTTRDDGQDSDISLTSADDIWITANDTVELTSNTDDVVIYTDANNSNNSWRFQNDGALVFPDNTTQTTAYTGGSAGLVVPFTMKDTNGDDLLGFEKGGTGVTRINALQDDLALRSARDIILYPGDDGPGNVYVNWGDATIAPNATNRVATIADIQAANTGDITFVDSTISNDTGDDIVIQNTNQDDVVKARITLDQSNEQVLIEAIRENDDWFNDSQWSTAVWSGSTVSITNTPDIINFFNTVPGNITRVSINNGASVTYEGASYGDNATTINVGGTPPAEQDPLTITEIRFYYSEASVINIDHDDNQFDIIARGMSMTIDSSGDLEINARDEDIDLRANDDIRFTANWNNGGTEPQWRLTNSGRFELPGDGYIENPIDSSSDNSNYDTIKIVPDSNLLENSVFNVDQYIVIDPTGPNHIHIRAGGTIDESTADLILGGERNKVQISDDDRQVVVTSRPPLVINTYLNTNPESDTNFVTGFTADIQIGYTVNVGGTDYIVDAIMAIDEGVIAVTANGAVFNAGQNYTFTFEPFWDNQWTFDSNGTFYGPTEPGYVKVNGLYGQNDSPLAILGPQSVVISGDGGEFLDDASDPANQIATIGDVANYVDGFLDSSTGTTVEYIDQQDAATLAAANEYADSLVLAAEGFNYLGEWDSETQYSINDVVVDDGSSYICITNSSNVGVKPSTATYGTWDLFTAAGEGFRWTGTWSSMGYNGFSYVARDVVEYEGSTYLCTPQMGMANSQPPIFAMNPNAGEPNPDWELMASAGATGEGFVWKGAWQSMPMTPYVEGDVVFYNSSTYVATPDWMGAAAGSGTPGGMYNGWKLMASGFNWRGAYEQMPNPTYKLADVVSRNGNSYIAISEYITGHPGEQGGESSWALMAAAGEAGEGLVWRGGWNGSIDPAYSNNDLVVYSGSTYIVTDSNLLSSSVPPDNNDGQGANSGWALFTAKGADGADGEGPNWRGEWQENADPAYQENDAVSYNGSSYIGQQIGAGSWSNPPGSNNDYWILIAAKGTDGTDGTSLTWRGEWTGANSATNDVVSYNGSTYIAKLDSPGEPPTNTTYWDLVAAKGTDGTRWFSGPGDPNVSPPEGAKLNDYFFSTDTGDVYSNANTYWYLDGNIKGEDGADAELVSETSFTVNGGTTATQPTFNGAPLFSGTYVKTGPMVHFQIQVDMDNITNFGTGQYYVDLPFDAKYGYQFKEGCLHDISSSNQYAIGGHVAAGTNRLFLTYTGSNGQDELFDHDSPVTLNVADNFHISGTYITN